MMMDQAYIKTRLAPCGLHCGKCFAFQGGDIARYSLALKTELGEFSGYAQRFVSLLEAPVFEKYPDFKAMLDFFSVAGCKGCRNEVCKLFKDCNVRLCSEEKGVDYCFQCSEFPCAQTGFDEHLNARWKAINIRMKKIGIDMYYLEIKDRPRY